MTDAPGPPRIRIAIGPTVPILVAVAALAAYGTTLPTIVAVAVVAAGLVLGVALRGVRASVARAAFPIPVLVALGITALAAGVDPFEWLVVGLSGAAVVAWLADDPFRSPRGAARGALEWLVPTLGVGIAWASSFLLPRSTTELGVAGGLAAGALVVLAYLLSRPDLFDQDASATI